MKLTEENYYSKEANEEYMSVSQFKEFAGTYGRSGCEFAADKKMKGEWEGEKSTALLIGGYVDAFYEGRASLQKFRSENPELFKLDGTLKKTYEMAETVILRTTKDDYFQKFMSGEKQRIMTGELYGMKWKIKMDSYIPNVCITDLKVMKSIRDTYRLPEGSRIDWVRYWGYDIQGAVYQEIVRQNTGKKLPFYIAAATKEKEPDIEVIEVTQNYLNQALTFVESHMHRIVDLKNGDERPTMCGLCDCCKHFRVLKKPISIVDLMSDI